MRLVWAVIPLILIVSMIGIVGIQESHAQCCLGPFSGNLTISEPPKLNDTAQITFEITSASFGPKEVPDYHARILLPEGFELVSGTLNKTAIWQTEKPFTVQATIKAVQTGDWIINGVGRDSAADSLAVRVSENYAIVQYDVYSPGPIFPLKSFVEESKIFVSGNDIDFLNYEIDEHNPAVKVFVDTKNNTIVTITIPKEIWYPTDNDCNPDTIFVLLDGQEVRYEEDYVTPDAIAYVFEIEIPKDVKLIEFSNGSMDDSSHLDYGKQCWQDYKISLMSPVKQLKNNIFSENIICKEGLELIFKQDNSPACVKSSTAEKLIERGWIMPTIQLQSSEQISLDANNYTSYIINSTTMMPILNLNDIVYVDPKIEFMDVEIGDIIVFHRPTDSDKTVVHRIASVIHDDPYMVRTEGDANLTSIPGTDFPITEKEFFGKVVRATDSEGNIIQNLVKSTSES